MVLRWEISYDIIIVCESHLTDIATTQVPKLDGYEFVSANHPGTDSY